MVANKIENLSLEDVAAGRIPLSVRLKAWWDGYDTQSFAAWLATQRATLELPVLEAEAETEPETHDGIESGDIFDEPKVRAPKKWDPTRCDAVQALWGAGFIGPGGPQEIVAMSKLLALSPEMSMIEFGAGLGGPARTLAEEFGVWITAYERDPALVDGAVEQCTMAGMARKVQVAPYDPEQPLELERRFDRAMAKEELYQVRNKSNIVRALSSQLKPGGLFLLIDYVLDDGVDPAEDDDIREWILSETPTPYPTYARDLENICNRAELMVRVSEDITEQYCTMVEEAWAEGTAIARKLAEEEEGAEIVEALLLEGEMWQRRLNLIKSGKLRIWRLLSARLTEKQRLLSNW